MVSHTNRLCHRSHLPPHGARRYGCSSIHLHPVLSCVRGRLSPNRKHAQPTSGTSALTCPRSSHAPSSITASLKTMKQSMTPAPPTANSSAPGQPETPQPHPRSKPAVWRSKLSPRSASLLLAVAFGASTLIPMARLDWLNAIPALLTIWIGIRAFGWSLRSAALRAGVVALCLLLSAEFCLRTTSYHRSLQYERQGDLLFTPIPDQEYIEKISLTPSRINSVGLRGEPIDRTPRQHLVLSLGDSITYGYGVDDRHTYPALLEDALSRSRNGQFSILNAGVN